MAKWEAVNGVMAAYIRNTETNVLMCTKDEISEIARKLNAFDELVENVNNIAEFLNGEGDVPQIAFRRLRAAIAKAEAANV